MTRISSNENLNQRDSRSRSALDGLSSRYFELVAQVFSSESSFDLPERWKLEKKSNSRAVAQSNLFLQNFEVRFCWTCVDQSSSYGLRLTSHKISRTEGANPRYCTDPCLLDDNLRSSSWMHEFATFERLGLSLRLVGSLLKKVSRCLECHFVASATGYTN